MGPDAGLPGSAVPETRERLGAHPQDLLCSFSLWHWLLQHLHFHNIFFVKKTKKNKTNSHSHSSVFFLFVCLLLSKKKKKWNQILNGCFCVWWIPEERLKVFLSLLSECGAALFIHLLIISPACVYIYIVGRSPSYKHTQNRICKFFSRTNRRQPQARIILRRSAAAQMPVPVLLTHLPAFGTAIEENGSVHTLHFASFSLLTVKPRPFQPDNRGQSKQDYWRVYMSSVLHGSPASSRRSSQSAVFSSLCLLDEPFFSS